jgi:hypothetical protein
MSIIVALFLGLTVSAEEIFKDRKILKRESFLNLSRSSYLVSKILILFLLSAVQAFTFVIIANNILGIKGMFFYYWFALFSTSACANLLGLNISATFNSVVTIYIIIPLVMIPMMVLSGAMFEFDKLNRSISSVKRVPLIAEMMPTKWSYEALLVHQFKNNQFQKMFFPIEKAISIADFKQVYLIDELKKKLEESIQEMNTSDTIIETQSNVSILRNELKKEAKRNPRHTFNRIDEVNAADFSVNLGLDIRDFLTQVNTYYANAFATATDSNEAAIQRLLDSNLYQPLKDKYYNEKIADFVKKVYEKNKILETDNEFIQQIDPIFKDPVPNHLFDFRAHFYAPQKHFLGNFFDTYWFNVTMLWVFGVVFYISLYYELLLKFMNLFAFKFNSRFSLSQIFSKFVPKKQETDHA